MIVSFSFLSLGWMPLSGELNQILIFRLVLLIFKVVNLFLSYHISFLVQYHSGQITIPYIKIADHFEDIMTHVVASRPFYASLSKLGLSDIYAQPSLQEIWFSASKLFTTSPN